MAFSGFHAGLLLRVAGLLATLVVLAWMISDTQWYVAIGLCVAAGLMQTVLLVRHASRSGRETARFLDAIAFDDTSASFSTLARDPDFSDLGVAMTRVLDQLRSGRMEREEQAQYLQGLLAHVPVALISVDEHGHVQLLNHGARRLFAGPCDRIETLPRHGEAFAAALLALRPGESAIVRMERESGTLQLKAAATAVILSGTRHRLISLQTIETEPTAPDLLARRHGTVAAG